MRPDAASLVLPRRGAFFIAACWWNCRCSSGRCRQSRAPRDIHAALVDAYRGAPLVDVTSLEAAASLVTLDAQILFGPTG